MVALPAASSNAGIIGVAVGPGFRQLMRTPRSPYVVHARATYWFTTTFDMRYPPTGKATSAFSSHHFTASANDVVACSGAYVSSSCCQPTPAPDAMHEIDDP